MRGLDLAVIQLGEKWSREGLDLGHLSAAVISAAQGKVPRETEIKNDYFIYENLLWIRLPGSD